MSSVLGPIHVWLYNKILLQETITEQILLFNETKGYVPTLREDAKHVCGVVATGDLETIIDPANIHGWLQNQIHIAENRLSFIVTAITKDHQERFDGILSCAYTVGEEVWERQSKGDLQALNPFMGGSEAGSDINAKIIYQRLNNMLLDGMPCDHVNVLVSADEDETIYQRSICIHESYWIEQGGLIMQYYDIRKAFIEGYLAMTDFVYEITSDGAYHICRA